MRQYTLNHELGRDDALSFLDFQPLDQLVKFSGELLEPVDVILRVLEISDWMTVGHELNQDVLDSERLVDRIVVESPLLAAE